MIPSRKAELKVLEIILVLPQALMDEKKYKICSNHIIEYFTQEGKVITIYKRAI